MTKEELEKENAELKALNKKMSERIERLEGYERIVKKLQDNGFDTFMSIKDFCKEKIQLEKENAELKDKLKNLASVAEVRLANWQKYEKENAELKKRNGELAGQKASLQRWLGEAKVIIKELSDAYEYVIRFKEYADREVLTRAEQFLEEIK